MGLVFFICCRSHFLPSGGLLKSQMLLPGWVVSEPSSGLEMQWGGDTVGGDSEELFGCYRGAFCQEGGEWFFLGFWDYIF